MVKYCLTVFTLIITALCIFACAPKGVESASKTVQKGHPELSAAQKLQPCYKCHKDATPDIYDEWYNSRHGIGQVRCFQCHGGYEDFKVVPSMDRCAACHTSAMAKCPKDKKCWQCHSAHTFKAHK